MPQRFASSATASWAWRLVPRKRMVLPLPLCSLTNRAASRNSFNVFCRSMMWIPLRSPKMYSFILGFQRRVWWPKWTPASSSSFIVISTAKFPPLRIAACGSGWLLLAGLKTGHNNLAAEQPSCRQLAGHDLVPASRNGALPRGRSKRPRGPLTQRLALGELESLSRALLTVLLALLHTRVARQETVLAQRRPQLRIETRNCSRQSHAHRAGLPANAAAIRGHDYVHLVRQARKLQRFGGVMLPGEIGEILLHRSLVDRELARAGAQKHARDRFLAAARTQKPVCARDGRTRRTQRSS